MDDSRAQPNAARPLDGVRVLELGQLMAGPFAGTILAYFGAEVIKLEPPAGDPVRSWRVVDDDGTSLWWRSLGRNKKSVAVDLRRAEGRAIARRLALESDVLIENFRPGTLERWGLDPEALRRQHPGLIVCRVSGYGQTGPLSSKPGFAAVCEAFGGLRYVTGQPGQVPVRSNLSLGDSLCGVHAALGVLLALIHRDRTGQAQDVDLAIYEAVFNMLEAVIPEFDRAGVVREPSGTTITGVVPTGTYRCADGKDVVIGGSGDSIFRRLMVAIGRGDLAEDPRLATNDRRVGHRDEIDRAIEGWCGTLDSRAVLGRLEEAGVACGPIYSAAELHADPHVRARGMIEEVDAEGEGDGGRLGLPAIAPRLSATPGRTDWSGRSLGADTADVLGGLLGIDDAELAALRAAGVCGGPVESTS